MSSTLRHRSRELALQALYFWEVGRTAPDEAIDHVLSAQDEPPPESVCAFTRLLVAGAVQAHEELDGLIGGHIDNWRIERLAVVDRLILRLATWELRYQPETPPAVIVNEALELARTFSADESVKFVNGVLDSIRKALVMDGA